MDDWREFKLGYVAEVVGGGTPRTDKDVYWNGDIPWLTPRDLTGYNNTYISRGERNITELGLKNSSAKILPKGAVLLTSRAPIGYVAISENPICTNQGFKSLIPKEDILLNIFVYYWIKCNIEYLKSVGTGTTFEEISGSVVKELDILLPPLPEQKAIAGVLSSLDDKIDLLHRQNKTLEAMAEALFRQWFVVEADEGWQEKPISEFVSVVDNRGKTPPYREEHTPYPVIEVNALGKSNRLVDYSVIKKFVEEETFNNWFRDRLSKYDTLISTVGSIGAISMYVIEKGNIAQNVIGLHAENISPFFLYQFMKYKVNEILQYDIGGVQPSIKVPHLLSISIPIPPKEKQNQFNEFMYETLNKMEINYLQIQALVKLRDTLLPNLMSGEVRVAV